MIVAFTVTGVAHPFAVSIYTYGTTIFPLVVLIKVSLILSVPDSAILLIPGITALPQVKVVPETELTGI